MNLTHFKLSEFDGKDEKGERIPGTGGNMRASTLLKCDALREAYGKPLRVASGWRSDKRNIQVGGVKNSSHPRGYAVDFASISNEDLTAFLDAAWKAGFRRFGIMATSVHVDDDPTKSQDTMWTYPTTPNTRYQIAVRWMAGKFKEDETN